MSEERNYRYKLNEEEQRRIRINALKNSLKGSISKWKTVISRPRDLGIEMAVSKKEEWIRLNRDVDNLAKQALFENNENRLRELQQEIENSIVIANNLIKTVFEQELERQRKEEALKKALSALELLKTTLGAAQSNELVKKWCEEDLNQAIRELERIEALIKEEKYEDIPDLCEILKEKVISLSKISEEKERKYLEVTSVKDKIVQVLFRLNFIRVRTKEEKRGGNFYGYTIIAEGQLGREVVTEIRADGKVKDTFRGYQGEECLKDADGYEQDLITNFGVKMEDIKENPPRRKPKPHEKIQKPLPREEAKGSS